MIFLAFLALVVSQGTHAQRPNFTPSANSPEDTSISSRFNYFDIDLLEAFDDSQNYFVSPASIKATLGMLLEGARGLCAEEIRRALRIPWDPSTTRNKLNSLLYHLNAPTGSTGVESANGAFISDVFRIVPEFENNINQYYGAEIRSLNFSNAPAASKLINGWVRDTTHGLIPEIVNPAIFNADATLVLANALYFKGLWKNPFEKTSTFIKCFRTKKNNCRNAKMMQTTENFNYKFIDEFDAQAIQLPYGDGKYAMLVLLPSEKHSVKNLITDLQHTIFISIVSRLEPTEVLINLPKFEIEYSGDIVPILQNLGIHEIFNRNANLSGIIERGQIKVNNIVHKAKIVVEETGIEAAAVSGVIVIPRMGTSMPRFIADRPFLFFIYHVESNNILFEGRVNEVPEVYLEIWVKPQNISYSVQPITLPPPTFCGYQQRDDYLDDNNATLADEFPWVAALIYEFAFDGAKAVLCSGALINTRYVLTAAQCLTHPEETVLVKVRLGEYNIKNATDCFIPSGTTEQQCINATDFDIQEQIVHPQYNRKTRDNDIALLRLDRTLEYNEFIRPICLYSQGPALAKTGDFMHVSGWGSTNFNGEQAEIKKKVITELITREQCVKELKGAEITENQLCSKDDPNNKEFTCEGDAGAPVMFVIGNVPQWHLEGIASWGAQCGSGLRVHTKVVNYITWIIENIHR